MHHNGQGVEVAAQVQQVKVMENLMCRALVPHGIDSKTIFQEGY
jgi:hypothetical protein